MKPVIYNDVLALVGVLSSRPASARAEIGEQILAEARRASEYVRRYAAAHPIFGDGSVQSAAARHDASGDVSFRDLDALDAWGWVIARLKREVTV